MNTPTTAAPDAGRSPVEALTDQRNQLQQWLARLDEVQTDAPDHVAERVREDYLARLRAVNEELAAHRDSIVEDLAGRRAELEEVEGTLARARDVLEESRLRHRIGELSESDWDVRRPGLEDAVSTAEGEVERVRGEVERLDSLLGEMDGGGEEEAAEAEAPPTAVEEPPAEEEAPAGGEARAAEEFSPGPDDTIPEWMAPAPAAREEEPADEDATVEGVDLAWLEEIETTTLGGGDATAADAGDPSVDDLAFLEELDRAISGGAAAPAEESAPAPRADPDRTLDADRAGMLLCKECGAINEPQSWYCEVCGSEL